MVRCSCSKRSPTEREPHRPTAPGTLAKKRLLEESFGRIFKEPEPRGWRCARLLLRTLKALGLSVCSPLLKFGEDWIFLFLLGISMATISFGLDVVTSKFQQGNLWVYDELEGYRHLQYFSWTLYHVALMVGSAATTQYISPRAAGSGIPELKVALRGVVLDEFFTFRTFVAKLLGIVCTLAGGSTIFLGKVGPFVHMATILATLLGKVMVSFAGSAENSTCKYELLIAGAAVGVACCFVAPVGGVLFGVEVTGTHFAVRDYWRGFFAATCAALTFRLLAVLNNTRETVAVLFRTSWRVEFPYDLPELLSYAVLGIVCGVLCCVFLFCHRNMLMIFQTWPKVHCFMTNNRIVYAGVVSLVLASLTFPHALGQYIGARLSMKELLETFFNNVTWGLEKPPLGSATHPLPNLTYDANWLQWTHPNVSTLEMLALFLIAKFLMLLAATTMVVPAGYFLPVFVYGAALGRLYGELMAKIFPDGIISDGLRIKITPAGYALAGAAAYSGAVTQTISTALLTFELTGQMSHILPVLVAVLIANAISQCVQPSFFDGIIIVKKLPFLPKLAVGKSGGNNIFTEDFMVTDLKYLTRESKFKDLWTLLNISTLKQFPLVDSEDSRVLLGSIKRQCLSERLSEQLSTQKRFQYLLSQSARAARPQEREPGGFEEKGKKLETSKEAEEETSKEASFDATETSWTEAAEEPLRSEPGGGGHLPEREKQVEEWEFQQLQETLCLEDLPVDLAPYRLLEKQTLYQCYDLFSLLGLQIAYVTNMGRLVGVVSLKELKTAVEGCVKGSFPSRAPQHSYGPEDKQELKAPEEAQRSSSLV